MSNFKLILIVDGWGSSGEIAYRLLSLDLAGWDVDFGSGDGNKPSAEPMLAQVSNAIWRHQATVS